MIGTHEDRTNIACVSLVEMIASMHDKRGTLLAEWLIDVPSGVDTAVVEAEIIRMTNESDPTLVDGQRVTVSFRLACPVDDAEIIETMRAMMEQEDEDYDDDFDDEEEDGMEPPNRIMH